jgi:hypothetical protein
MKNKGKMVPAVLALIVAGLASVPAFAYDDWKLLKFLQPKQCDWRQTKIARDIVDRCIDADDGGFGKPLDSEITTDGDTVRELPFPNGKRLSITYDGNQITDLFMKDDRKPGRVRHVKFIGYGRGGLDEIRRDGKAKKWRLT